MPGQVAGETIVAGNGKIMVAPVGTTSPLDADDAWPAGWVDLGYANEDGVTVTPGLETEDIPAWQTPYPIRTVVTTRRLTVAFVLRQWNKDTVRLALGGGTITALTAPQTGHKYSPPAPEFLDERELGIEWVDGTKQYRWIVPKVILREDVEIQLQRGDAANLPLNFGLLAPASGDPWYLLSNDPSWA